MSFAIAQAISKNEFLEVYRDAVSVTQLIFAPFGLSPGVVDVLGNSKALEVYTTTFQQWEDLVSRRVFSAKGFDDDRIIASMHKYVGGNQMDTEVVSEVRSASEALSFMLQVPASVLFDFPEVVVNERKVDPCSAAAAAMLVRKVISTLKCLFETSDAFVYDDQVYKSFGIKIPASIFNAPRKYDKSSTVSQLLGSAETIDKIRSCLTLSVAELSGDASASGPNYVFTLQQYYALLDAYRASPELTSVLSEFTSTSSGAAAASTSRNLLSEIRSGTLLSEINHASLHPVVTFVEQLTSLLPRMIHPGRAAAKKSHKKHKKAKKDHTEDDDDEEQEEEEEDSDPDTESSSVEEGGNQEEGEEGPLEPQYEPTSLSEKQLERINASLSLTLSAVRLMQEAHKAHIEGDFDTAIDCLSQVINKSVPSDNEEDEVTTELKKASLNEDGELENEEESGVSIVIPSHLRVLLYIERATMYAEQYELSDAMEDITIALQLDPLNGPAYSLRSQIATAQLEKLSEEQQLQDEEEDFYVSASKRRQQAALAAAKKATDADEKARHEAEKMSVMVSAAEDALAAFLLGGSSDLALAAAAEETAREQCRLTAKDIFKNRSKSTAAAADAGDADNAGGATTTPSAAVQDSMPRTWLVASYYSGYTFLRTALSVDYTAEEVRSKAASVQPSSTPANGGGSLNDICDDSVEEHVGDEAAAVTELPSPPAHLLDEADPSQPPKEHDIDEGEYLTGGIRETDRAAYHLLSLLVEAFESATYSSKNNCSADETPAAASADDKKKEEEEAQASAREEDPENVVYHFSLEDSDDSIIALVESKRLAGELMLVDLGVVEPSEPSYEAFNAKHVYVGASESKDDNQHSTVAAASKEAASTSDTLPDVLPEGVGAPCPHFQRVLHLLTAPSAVQLTGVVFNANGTIASLQYDTNRSDYEYPKEESSSAVAAAGKNDDSENEEDDDDEGYESPFAEEQRYFATGSRAKPNKKKNNSSHKKNGKNGKRKNGHSQHHQGGFPAGFESMFEHEGEIDADQLFEFMAAAAGGNMPDGGMGGAFRDMYFGDEDDDEEEEDYNPDEDSEPEDEEGEEEDHYDPENEEEEQEQEQHWAPPSKQKQPETNKQESRSAEIKKSNGESQSSGAAKPVAATAAPISKKTVDPEKDEGEDDEGEWEDCDDDDDDDNEVDGREDHEKAAAGEEGEESEGEWEDCSDDDDDDNDDEDEDDEDEEVKEEPVAERTREKTKKASEVISESVAASQPTVAASVAKNTEETKPSAESSASQQTDLSEPIAAAAAAASRKVLPDIGMSHRLRARLLNLCGSVAYLAGDALGAVACFRASLLEDEDLLDSRVKLGSLLVDLDENDEAARLLKDAKRRQPNDPVVLLHFGELMLGQSDFEKAVHYLRKAQQMLPYYHSNRSSTAAVPLREQRERLSVEDVQCNIAALLGVSLFRLQPTRPEIAMSILEEGLSEHPNSVTLLICSGEVNSQAGDMVKALKSFKRAHALDGGNPLPFVNAARTYQQLGQYATAAHHLHQAIALDPALSMTRVDVAQNHSHMGRTKEALDMLQTALLLARQVSEIRDVLTAINVTKMQLTLEQRGLYCPNSHR